MSGKLQLILLAIIALSVISGANAGKNDDDMKMLFAGTMAVVECGGFDMECVGSTLMGYALAYMVIAAIGVCCCGVSVRN